ncbi:hypothetical protein CH380_15470 [Leptospira adleri]|uniref:Uncharacterized protein n=1 Tax=Leptospira adleri TaxID=2023186 RepID=A0A2M9YLB7_9LEPT|nr:hypothetical protein CH380_15470 [Leptospira adleri]PJZ63511.1 hypothetical protein CH376_02490 [Leptospira adleri]
MYHGFNSLKEKSGTGFTSFSRNYYLRKGKNKTKNFVLIRPEFVNESDFAKVENITLNRNSKFRIF